MNYKTVKHSNAEKGFSLILALLTLLLISAIAAGLVMMSNTETNISSNFRDEQRAFFSARGGVEEIRDRLRPAAVASLNANLGALSTPIGGANSVLYVTNAGGGPAVQPWNGGNGYFDPEICQEVTGVVCAGAPPLPPGGNWYLPPAVAAGAPYAAAPPLDWKWTRITLKTNGSMAPNYANGNNAALSAGWPVCWNGSNEVSTSATPCLNQTPSLEPVFLITSYAVTPSGSHRMIQSEATLVTFPPLPGALTFAGPGAVYGSTNSNPFHIDGTDTASPVCPPAGNKPAIAAYDANSQVNLTGELARPDHYTGYPPGSSTSVSPSVSNTGPSAVPPANTMGALGTVTGLQNLVNTVTSIADQIVPPPGGIPSNLGSPTNPLVNVVQGNLDFSTLTNPVHGYGILLVTGNVTFTGNTSWDGVVLVIGTGSLTVRGGGSGQFNGGVLVANINSGVVGNTPGPPNVNWSGGGGNGIYYNSCDANNLFNNRTGYFRMVATRELMR